MDGEYSLKIPREKVTMVFSFIGYKTLEKSIDANTTKLDISLSEDTELLDEVIVVGYGTMKKKECDRVGITYRKRSDGDESCYECCRFS